MHTKEAWKTRNDVFDEFTYRTLFKLESEGHFQEPLSPIKIGKEANIFWAPKDGSKVILKIYRLMTCDFNKMYDYIRADPRYINIKKQQRRVIFSFVQREYRNLLLAREAGLRVPTPYTYKNHILVEEFIGHDEPAPQLKDCIPFDPENVKTAVFENIEKLYAAGYVHGDLSAFNILLENEKPIFIDFSQTVPVSTPNARALYERDKKNIQFFFNKLHRHHGLPPRTQDS